MSQSTELLSRNRAFAATDAHTALGMRNVGGRVTPAVLQDLAFFGQAAEAATPEGPLFEVFILHHTQCGAAMLANDGMRASFARRIGADEAALRELAVTDPESSIRADVAKVRAADFLPPRLRVSGHVYDMASGTIRTVVPVAARAEP